jgi:hypothetical protein
MYAAFAVDRAVKASETEGDNVLEALYMVFPLPKEVIQSAHFLFFSAGDFSSFILNSLP